MVHVACRLAPDLALAAAAIGGRCAPTASTVGGCRTSSAARATTATPACATAAPLGSGYKEVTGIGAMLHRRLE